VRLMREMARLVVAMIVAMIVVRMRVAVVCA
jgi:hypothetical protein